jgi:hypothetical protein
MIQRVVGKIPNIRTNKTNHTVIISLYGKRIEILLRRFLSWRRGNKTQTIALKSSVFYLGREFLKGIVRGLVAGDGSVNPGRNSIKFGVISRKLANQYRTILTTFGIRSSIYRFKQPGRKVLYSVETTSIEMARRFRLSIGLTDPARQRLLNQIHVRR